MSDDTIADGNTHNAPPFAIFRARDAVDYGPDGPMVYAPDSLDGREHMAELGEAGMYDGSAVKLLYSRLGMSLTHVWFKSGYPLPLHSHSADCLYFIVAGSLKIGTESLGPGDGFFLGSDVPYAYTAGENGVEVLEFRTSNRFDFQSHAKGAAYWARLVETFAAARANWDGETPPSGMKIG